ncbi:MAG: hypothetical protein ACI4BD_04365 [Paludibacteraceae bacterium]
MRKVYSLFAALMVAMFAFAQTKPTVTVTLSSTGFVATPEPITEVVFYVAQATAAYNFSETVTPQTYMQNYVTSMSSLKFDILNTAGAKEVDFENCGNLTDDGSNTILAVTVSVIDNVRTLTSDVVRVDTVFTKSAGGGDEPETPEEPVEPEEPVSTIEPGKYYIATTFAGEEEDEQFFASMGSGRSFNLGATLFNGTTPTEIHEFEFEAVEGKQAVFYIKNGTNYLNTSTRNNFFAASATANEACEWKVVVLDEEEGNVKISHVQTEKIIFFEHYVDEETSEVTNWYVCKQAVNAPATNAEYPFLIPVVEPEPISATVTIELNATGYVVTPDPETEHVFFFAFDTEDYLDETYTEQDLVEEFIGYYESEEEMNEDCPVGVRSGLFTQIGLDLVDVPYTFVAATVVWTEAGAVLTSEVVRKDTIFAEVPGEGGDEPAQTIDAGKYYVSSTIVGETDNYLLTTTTGSVVMLPATKYVDENTPKATHEFDFVSVDGQDACFTIQDHTGAFLALTKDGWNRVTITFAAAKPDAGATWKVTLQDEENHVTIENTDNNGDLHCMKVETEVGFLFGTEAAGKYNLLVLSKVKGASTGLQETTDGRQVFKTIENGQLILNIDGVRYNILGIAL